MQSLRRTAGTAARKARTTLPRQPRRYAHDAHGHGHSEPVNESMGIGFWLTIGTLPAGYALYWISHSDDPNAPPALTRLINKYTDTQERLLELNHRHVSMLEQAGADQALFLNSKYHGNIEMKFPEIMNQGSPYNVPAGSINNMDKVIEKFRKQAAEDNERKLEALRTNTIKGEQPFVDPYVMRK